MKRLFIITIIAALVFSNYVLSECDKEIESLRARLADAQQTILTLRAIDARIPLLEQILPDLTNLELNLLAEKLKQAKERRANAKSKHRIVRSVR